MARPAERSTDVPPRRPPRRATQAASRRQQRRLAHRIASRGPLLPVALPPRRASHSHRPSTPSTLQAPLLAHDLDGGPSPSRRLPGLSDSRPPYQPSAITRSARRLKRRRKSGIAIRRDDATPRCSHPAWTNPAAIPGRRSSSGRDSPLRTQYLAPIASSETPTMYTPRRRSASNPSHAAEPAAVGHRASKWTCAVLPPEDRRHRFVSSSDT